MWLECLHREARPTNQTDTTSTDSSLWCSGATVIIWYWWFLGLFCTALFYVLSWLSFDFIFFSLAFFYFPVSPYVSSLSCWIPLSVLLLSPTSNFTPVVRLSSYHLSLYFLSTYIPDFSFYPQSGILACAVFAPHMLCVSFWWFCFSLVLCLPENMTVAASFQASPKWWHFLYQWLNPATIQKKPSSSGWIEVLHFHPAITCEQHSQILKLLLMKHKILFEQ